MSPSPAIGRLSAALLDPRGPRISRDASRRFVLSRDAGCFTGLAISRGPTGDNPTWQRAGSALEAGAPEREDVANLSFGPDLRFAIATRFLPPLNGWASSLGNLLKPHDAISKAITRLELRKGGRASEVSASMSRHLIEPRLAATFGPEDRTGDSHQKMRVPRVPSWAPVAPGIERPWPPVTLRQARGDRTRSGVRVNYWRGGLRQLNPTNATTIPARPIPPSRPAFNAR